MSYKIENYVSKEIFGEIITEIFNTNGKYDEKIDDPFFKCFIESTEKQDFKEFSKKLNKYKNIQMKLGSILHEKISKHICKDTTKKGELRGIDIIWKKNKEETAYFQLKNKQNTTNSDSKENIVNSITKLKNENKSSKFYIVTIIRWSKEKKNDNYEEIGGKTFYELITGDKFFFYNLLETFKYACNFINKNSLEEYIKFLNSKEFGNVHIMHPENG